ncbi:MAG: nitric oxide reductase activation protein NorD [Thioalkalivibrionaceae bacterium]
MSSSLDDFKEQIETLPEVARAALHERFDDARRVFSPRGLEKIYVDGARALASLGRGDQLVVDFIDGAPHLAERLGEDAVQDVISTAIRLVSKTSAVVIGLLIASAPRVGERFGDRDLLQGYLRLIDHLAAQAPRGLRGLLEHIDELLDILTLGGLRRWASFGAQAHRTDLEAQLAYFSLESADSKAVLQRERRGTLFVDVQRRLNIYLRALWGRDFFMRPTSGDYESREGYRPYIEGFTIFLPDAYDADVDRGVTALDHFRAAAAHAAAHQVLTTDVLPHDEPKGVFGALVELFEDYRIEALAMQRFPGLRALWARWHTARAADGDAPAVLMARTARALFDPDYRDAHEWIAQVREIVRAAPPLDSERWAWNVAEQATRYFPDAIASARALTFDVGYRDDNRYIWQVGKKDSVDESVDLGVFGQKRRYVSLMEMINTLDNPFANDESDEIWVLATEFYRDGEDTSINAQEGKPPVSLPFRYHEFDYQTQLERPDWCTLVEKRPVLGDVDVIDSVVERHRPILTRLKFLIESLQPQGVQRLRKQVDGEEFDLNALIEATIDRRSGHTPSERVYLRNRRHVRDLSVLLLIDLSESTNEKVKGSDVSVLELARDAAVLLAGALDKIGDPFAIHGFDSAGRHDVEYFRFKDFDEPFRDRAKARLAGMTGQLSTRMGTAIRHAGAILERRASSRKILLVLTDGEPADTDVRDPQYLKFDAKRAVEEVGRIGVQTFCISLDPQADEYVERIFGSRRFLVIDDVQRLPDRLPLLYGALTR